MTVLMKILKNHGIEFKVVDNRVIATEYVVNENGEIKDQQKDLTDCNRGELSIWLGY